MKIESIRHVKSNLNQLVSSLAEAGSVLITKNGRPCAVLMPVTEDTDLEILALSQSKRLWRTFDRAVAKAEKDGWTPLDEV